MELLDYYKKGISYQEYKDQMEKEAKLDSEYSKYISLNFNRMNRVEKVFKLNDERKKALENVTNDFLVLTITEPWCGDAAQILPIAEKIFDYLGIAIRYIMRDQHMDLMKHYRTNGADSIPIIIGFNEVGEVFNFGPRPAEGMMMLMNYKANKETYPKEKFYKDLQQFYNKDKGNAVFNELVDLIQKK